MIIPESPFFQKLLDFEKKVDSSIVQRKLELQEVLKIKPQKVIFFNIIYIYKKKKSTFNLRICIYNLYNNQEPFYQCDPSFSVYNFFNKKNYFIYSNNH